MNNDSKTLWGIHGGKTGDADYLFIKKKYIAISWERMPDLITLGTDRNAFKKEYEKQYPEAKKGAIPNIAGQLFRFVHEVQKGDLVAYPSRFDRKIHIGKILDDYWYKKDKDARYPHRRTVEWLKSFPRTEFSQGALFEIGSAMTFFQIKNYYNEFIDVLSGIEVNERIEVDDTIGIVADEIEETTQDFILKKLTQELKGHPFEEFIAHLLSKMGYQSRISPEGPDGGVDIVASKDELGFEPPIIKVQVKSSQGAIGNPDVTALYGNVDPNEFGLLITLGSFSNPAKNFARNKTNLRLVDGPALVGMVLNHYEQFDAKYKGLIPLKRVYIPEAKTDSARE